jgi:hypothetical protein
MGSLEFRLTVEGPRMSSATMKKMRGADVSCAIRTRSFTESAPSLVSGSKRSINHVLPGVVKAAKLRGAAIGRVTSERAMAIEEWSERELRVLSCGQRESCT